MPTRDLSDREKQVLALVASGCTSEQVARRLYLSRDTVKDHLSRINEALRTRNRTHAVAVAVSRNLITLPTEGAE